MTDAMALILFVPIAVILAVAAIKAVFWIVDEIITYVWTWTRK